MKDAANWPYNRSSIVLIFRMGWEFEMKETKGYRQLPIPAAMPNAGIEIGENSSTPNCCPEPIGNYTSKGKANDRTHTMIKKPGEEGLSMRPKLPIGLTIQKRSAPKVGVRGNCKRFSCTRDASPMIPISRAGSGRG